MLMAPNLRASGSGAIGSHPFNGELTVSAKE